ncbi:Spherulation-specific family 4 [Cerioporus squamosus]|nr:Spherulation-specific family 4 [Cerioporus squamosus]
MYNLPRAAAAAAATLSSGVLIPLYINPVGSPDCSGWAPLLSTITAHPTVPFWTIINPNSGPGNPNTQAGPEYQQCIPQLLNKPNVVVLGYVATFEGTSSHQARATTDINTYNGWAVAYRPDGIFFDQVSGLSADFATYQTFTSHASSLFNFVALNPGSAPQDTRYYNLADLLLTAENFFNQFTPSQLSLNSSTPASKQAVVLHDGPSTPSTSLISQLITTDRIKAFYVTDDVQANNQNPYDMLPTDLESFVAAVQAA